MYRLILALAAHMCDKNQNLMCWLIYCCGYSKEPFKTCVVGFISPDKCVLGTHKNNLSEIVLLYTLNTHLSSEIKTKLMSSNFRLYGFMLVSSLRSSKYAYIYIQFSLNNNNNSAK